MPTDLSLPTDFTPCRPRELTNLNIPGYNSDCLSVGLAYAGICLATYSRGCWAAARPSTRGTAEDDHGPRRAGSSRRSPATSGARQVAAEANGKSFTEVSKLFESEKFTTATKHIEDWMTANCGG